jgi:hypothetical protein
VACCVELTWTDDDAASAPAGSQLLTAQVHVSRHRSAEQVCLDAVLQRLREALPVSAANGSLTVRCRETTREVVDSGVDTVFKATTFEVAPRAPRHPNAELLDLPPWTERPDATAPFSPSDLVAPHPWFCQPERRRAAGAPCPGSGQIVVGAHVDAGHR